MVLDYSRDPRETPEDPFLSSAGMAERFAMYNMYLGFRAAVDHAETNHNCAAAALSATRRRAQTWLAQHEADQDLAADLTLADQFLANLREQGADPNASLGQCPQLDPDGWPDDEGHYRHGFLCSSTNASPGWLLVIGAVLLAGRRRRARRA
jgi:MYXO-CTERM domain-containing protein